MRTYFLRTLKNFIYLKPQLCPLAPNPITQNSSHMKHWINDDDDEWGVGYFSYYRQIRKWWSKDRRLLGKKMCSHWPWSMNLFSFFFYFIIIIFFRCEMREKFPFLLLFLCCSVDALLPHLFTFYCYLVEI